jgi:hypothetical protein
MKKINKKTIKKQQAIEYWRTTRGNISNICQAIGITRQTFYNWLNKDKGFAEKISNCESELNDDIRDVLIHKAGDGNLQAVKFYLSKRHPDFMDKSASQSIEQDKDQDPLVIVLSKEPDK